MVLAAVPSSGLALPLEASPYVGAVLEVGLVLPVPVTLGVLPPLEVAPLSEVAPPLEVEQPLEGVGVMWLGRELESWYLSC